MRVDLLETGFTPSRAYYKNMVERIAHQHPQPWTPVTHRQAPAPPTHRTAPNRPSPREKSQSLPVTPRTDQWTEPKSAHEQQLQLKLLRTQQALQRARTELLNRSEGQRNKDARGSKQQDKDWTLALRFRLTSELRAELDRMTEGWEADRTEKGRQILKLEIALSTLKKEKEVMTSRLMQEVLELQRLFARTKAEREMMHEVLRPEIKKAEQAHEAHVAQLQLEITKLEGLRASDTQKLKADVGRLNAALTGVCEDLEEERERKKAMQATMGMEIDRLRADVEKLTTELGASQQLHAQDVAELRSEKNDLAMELTQTSEVCAFGALDACILFVWQAFCSLCLFRLCFPPLA